MRTVIIDLQPDQILSRLITMKSINMRVKVSPTMIGLRLSLRIQLSMIIITDLICLKQNPSVLKLHVLPETLILLGDFHSYFPFLLDIDKEIDIFVAS